MNSGVACRRQSGRRSYPNNRILLRFWSRNRGNRCFCSLNSWATWSSVVSTSRRPGCNRGLCVSRGWSKLGGLSKFALRSRGSLWLGAGARPRLLLRASKPCRNCSRRKRDITHWSGWRGGWSGGGSGGGSKGSHSEGGLWRGEHIRGNLWCFFLVTGQTHKRRSLGRRHCADLKCLTVGDENGREKCEDETKTQDKSVREQLAQDINKQ